MPIQYFISEYEDNVYGIKNKHRFNLREIICIIISVAMFMAIFIVGILSSLLYFSQLWIFIPYSICAGCFFVLLRLTSSRFKRERDQNAKEYIDTKILPLKNLLLKNQFYKLSSIDWLIDYCKEKLQPPTQLNKISFRDFFIIFIFPTVIFCGNAITESLKPDEKFIMGFIGILLLLFAYLVLGIFVPEIMEATNKSRKALQVLKRDLEYLRVKLI